MLLGLGLLLALHGSGAPPAPQHGFRQPPPEAYLDPVDREIARGHGGTPGRPAPCTHMEKPGGMEALVSAPTERCFRMEPPRRWRGLWRNDFEGSQFCPEPARRCRYGSEPEQIWLTERPERQPDGKLYRVEFIGRKTLYRGAYGHMGASDHEIVVDRFLSSRAVPDPDGRRR